MQRMEKYTRYDYTPGGTLTVCNRVISVHLTCELDPALSLRYQWVVKSLPCSHWGRSKVSCQTHTAARDPEPPGI